MKDLDFYYDDFPRIEEEFNDALRASLDPRGPSMLYDAVASLELAAGSKAVDVGCGEGRHALELASRFSFEVTGVDPVERHVKLSREAAKTRGVRARFLRGTAEALPGESSSVDLVWCRDVLVHSGDLPAAYREFERVLRPGGYAIIYQMFATHELEPQEARWLFETMLIEPRSAQKETTDEAVAASGLRVVQQTELRSEWGEYAEERAEGPSRLLRTSRLLRQADSLTARFGQPAYDVMRGDALWDVYRMIGKLSPWILQLQKPPEDPSPRESAAWPEVAVTTDQRTDIQDEISRITRSQSGVRWSVRIVNRDGEPVVDVAADKQLATASIGKLLLLTETARQLTSGELDPDEWLSRRDGESVGDSGLWQHLRVDRLPIRDVAALVASVSDNDATNVLLDRVGLPAVARLTSDLGLVRTRLLDRVRRLRTEQHPPHLSVGCGSELAALMSQISRRELVDSAVSEQLHDWLGLNTDLSMVAAPFHCDPLAHVESDHGLLLRNKTGTNAGVRADTGYVSGYAYAVLANWDQRDGEATHRVMSSMSRIGEQLALLVTRSATA